MTSLHDRLDVQAVRWEHEVDDRIVGTVIERGTWSSPEYGDSPTLTLLVNSEGSTEQGGQSIEVGSERIIYCSRTLLRSAVEEHDPRPGVVLAVKYLGVPDGKSYHAYKVIVEKAQRAEPHTEPEPAVFWDSEPSLDPDDQAAA